MPQKIPPNSGAALKRKTLHFSELLKTPVVSRSGEAVGKVDDVIVRLRGTDSYPLVTGLVVGVGGRQVFVPMENVKALSTERVELTKNKVDLRAFGRRDGEYLLDADILDHRFIDVPNAELVHAYDLELDSTDDGWVLASLDTRKPNRLFGLIKSSGGHASRDWRAFEPLIGHDKSMLVRRVQGRMQSMKAADIADLLEDANAAEKGEILDRVRENPELEADVFEELDPEKASQLFDDMSDADVAAVLGRMRADDAADAVFDLRQSRRRKVLDMLPAGQRTKVVTLMAFNRDSAGGLMNIDVVTCPHEAAADQALAVIAGARTLQPEALLKMHVLNADDQLVGVVSVIRLLQAEPATAAVADLMDSDPVRVAPEADLTDIALLMSDFNLATVPVVDDNDRLLGVVTYDDILEALIPEDWRRREPAPRPIRDIGTAEATRANGVRP
ncbi:magnesium transporter [Mycobacterium sp. CBMA293]|uniref:magnesium transporter MgtE N-terminal domain-containing protein n=1 Tax=unclassified Mycolicibacterium TaxID=2636767 RepID=UPI0012DFC7A4|nr:MULTISPECIES: CBS domain-containing protein [unclassified Mycolicibacterium]MUL48726.1 magnesium transporter [Mycolicibacterium sp. CBMA 360]MUL62180.1 magnesium transporter [Mycolicibacterium sp. CBMA 335]MUL71641.1 magnesium transporter [Mycolicibacterium sp. CBMA 311]MUL93596.1 magnesium transporter [Mycolicibacterium sp. CBMA 230]MUM09276.1 magnesium transporter MgtE [Mycolicibacterium sp. CBMA 213]